MRQLCMHRRGRSCKTPSCWISRSCDRVSSVRSCSLVWPWISSIPPCIGMTNVGISFWFRRHLRGSLWQRIVSAVQTFAHTAHWIAPGIVGARFTSRLFFSHIFSFKFCELYGTSNLSLAASPPHRNQRRSTDGYHCPSTNMQIGSIRCRDAGTTGIQCTVSANVAEDRHRMGGGEVRCTPIILSIRNSRCRKLRQGQDSKTQINGTSQ